MQDVFERNDELSIPESGYELRRERRGTSNRQLAIIASLIGVALLGIGGGLEFASRRSTGIPVITADNRPIRVRPDNPGGMQVIGANEGSAESGGEAMAPPPEAPDPSALKAQQQAELATRARPPVAAAQDASTPSTALLARTGAAAPDVPLPPLSDAKPAAVAPPAPAAKVVTPAPDAAAGGRHVVQLAAVASQDAAHLEWERLAKRMPDLLGGRQPEIVRYEHDGHTFFRVRTGGFADGADASAFCGRVKAKGANCAAF